MGKGRQKKIGGKCQASYSVYILTAGQIVHRNHRQYIDDTIQALRIVAITSVDRYDTVEQTQHVSMLADVDHRCFMHHVAA